MVQAVRMHLPLKITKHIGARGQIGGYIITDALGRSIPLMCDEDAARRNAACLWSPEEAEALAKQIARALTDNQERDAG